jgi:metal-responsive CopG/Arc/MetJ family transcriptional regulator
MVQRVNVSMSDSLFRQLEDARGDVSRSKFIERTLESALSETPQEAGRRAAGDRLDSTSVSTPTLARGASQHKKAMADRQKQMNRDRGR